MSGSTTNNASLGYTNNQRRIDPSTDWYFNGGRSISFEQGNERNTRVYGTTTLVNGINNTTVVNGFYGYVTLHSESPVNYTTTIYYSDGTTSVSSGESTGYNVGVFAVETGHVVASNQVISSGNYDEEIICNYVNIPIFREDDVDAIEE